MAYYAISYLSSSYINGFTSELCNSLMFHSFKGGIKYRFQRSNANSKKNIFLIHKRRVKIVDKLLSTTFRGRTETIWNTNYLLHYLNNAYKENYRIIDDVVVYDTDEYIKLYKDGFG